MMRFDMPVNQIVASWLKCTAQGTRHFLSQSSSCRWPTLEFKAGYVACAHAVKHLCMTRCSCSQATPYIFSAGKWRMGSHGWACRLRIQVTLIFGFGQGIFVYQGHVQARFGLSSPSRTGKVGHGLFILRLSCMYRPAL